VSDAKYLEMFPNWLRALGDDAVGMGAILTSDASEDAKRHVTSGLNYIFKSLDLIPDGIDDLGFLDDAFVIRVAARLAVEEAGLTADIAKRLGTEAVAVEEFLGETYPRLVDYVRTLHKGAARGRTVDDILGEEGIRSSFMSELDAWSKAYENPSFTREEKTLVKLRAFLSAKLA
jgi:uncharacterized membrane protein YkvA (DUF1232 family)